jgi:hypothetical protein
MAFDDGYELLVTKRQAAERYRDLCPGYETPRDPGVPHEGMSAEQCAVFTALYDADLAWESFKAATGSLLDSP